MGVIGSWARSGDAPNAVMPTETTAEYARFAELVPTKHAYTALLV